MPDLEKTRQRERERPQLTPYEQALQGDKEFAERQQVGRIVIRSEDYELELTRQGYLRAYLRPSVPDVPLHDWIVFTHEVRTKSGRHRHQGGLVIYVIEGVGYSVVDGERIDWQAGDLLLLPLKPDGVEHQHFNTNLEKPALWMAFIHTPLREYVASEMTQTEASPDFQKALGSS